MLEMSPMTEAEETETDAEMGMIDERVGEITSLINTFKVLPRAFRGLVLSIPQPRLDREAL